MSPIHAGVGYPVWATEVTPVTGKWRIETVEINGEIVVGDIRVAPGDIVFADDTGVVLHSTIKGGGGSGHGEAKIRRRRSQM